MAAATATQNREAPSHAGATVKRLASQLAGQRVRLGIVGASIVIYTVLTVYAPIKSAVVIDLLWEAVQPSLATGAPFVLEATPLFGELVQLAVIYLATWLFYYLQSCLMASVAETLVLSLRNQVAAKLNRLPLRFFDQNKAGEILSRVTNDLDKVSETLQTGLLRLLVAFGTVIGALVVMFYYSLPLTCVFLVFMAISLLITNVVAKKNLAYAGERQETLAQLTAWSRNITPAGT